MAAITSRGPALFLAGSVVGVLALGSIRLALTPAPVASEGVHYHANFAVFVDGERFDFARPQFMTDIATCAANPDQMLPTERAHMHELVPDVVHIHHAGATWGHFFANVGFVLGDDVLVTQGGDVHVAGAERDLTFVINGRVTPTVYNRVIESEDRLVISFGAESISEILETQFAQVPATADVFNQSHRDAGGCSSGAPVEETFWTRARRAFWL